MDKLAVLDFGGQYAHLIANRIRRIGVYCEILDPETELSILKDYKGIILSGGPSSVSDPHSPKCDPHVFEMGIPIMGICFGLQITAHLLGGKVAKGKVREYGHAEVTFLKKNGVFQNVKSVEDVWMSHFDQVIEAPEGFEVVGSTLDCPIAAMVDEKRNIYCMQFHPEVTHTPCGASILEKFVEITGSKKLWNMDRYIEEMIEDIRVKVGDKNVFLMISGGVDSSVAFMLLDKALGEDKVYGLFVDTGFMRLNERSLVENSLRAAGVKNLHVYDASKEYFEALVDVYEPEEKRKIIGDLFLDVQANVSEELGLNPDEWLLAQGTIYPDTIESGGSKRADLIKTHHNRVERIQKLIEEGKIIEPISQLYKDEVREVGRKLGLPADMVERHPFPGPGLAVRCLCSSGEDYPASHEEIEKEIDLLVGSYGLKGRFLPVKSVGVQGDERTYRHPIVLYGERLNWKELSILSTRLTNQFDTVNRVLFGLYPGALVGLTTQKSYLTRERILTIQKADKVVMDFIKEKNIDKEIWQFPTVLVPVKVNGSEYESLVLRPVCSTEAMTANYYNMNSELLEELVEKLAKEIELSSIFYDITNKPPGTIEWE